MMDEKSTGIGWIGFLLFFVVFAIVFGGGWFGNRNGYGAEAAVGGCGCVSNCEVQKQEIIDSARTQFLTVDTARQTQEANLANTRMIMDQASRIYEAQQAEKLFDCKMENMTLKNQIFTQAQTDPIVRTIENCCCSFNRRLDHIEDQMLKRQPIYGVAATCNGQIIPPITTMS